MDKPLYSFGEVKLGGRVFKINWLTRDDLRGLYTGAVGTNDNGQDTLAVLMHKDGIYYDTDTLLHEVLHSLFRMSGFEISDTEEEVVSRITPWLHTFIVQNPELIQAIIRLGNPNPKVTMYPDGTSPSAPAGS